MIISGKSQVGNERCNAGSSRIQGIGNAVGREKFQRDGAGIGILIVARVRGRRQIGE